ncbi:hypothetical protein A2872_04300 [Candidatus Gottesmanbacteria bacterium RIFCSPHIGHO2_01_FULL_42_12]|uniref:Uncharacterized protein n=1 Tax=Candidatus Gottesmanbacteria bacterium RIFCSPHIGHO2_01_FULL_42_12 TaxID=1798377 RepID=A0A1F5Z214_9BACT|nr:MAG: hypothetical protein A2872_04300 [Candidatus Gottesmanbacteria bacterium RIFCSPHIGHO2_01_FULL_42_12]
MARNKIVGLINTILGSLGFIYILVNNILLLPRAMDNITEYIVKTLLPDIPILIISLTCLTLGIVNLFREENKPWHFVGGIIVIILFPAYFFFGVPFIIPSYVCNRISINIGPDVLAENILTHQSKWFGDTCEVPYGWRVIERGNVFF